MATAAVVEKMVDLDGLGVRTRVLVAGKGAPVVLLHGNPDNADQWRAVIERLAAHHRCIAPDIPGYGQSPEPTPAFSYSVSDQIAFLDAVLDRCNVTEPVILVVHDIGGMMGIPWAAANLSRVRGLLITNTVAFEGFRWFAIARRWGDSSLLGRLRSTLMMKVIGLRGGRMFRQLFAGQNPQLAPAEVDRITRTFALSRDAKNATLRQFRQMMHGDVFVGFDQMNAKIAAQVPVQVLWGENDPYLDASHAHRFGGVTPQILPGVGHWVANVAPDAVATSVRQLAGGA
jgi:haloalkane dehalogenase